MNESESPAEYAERLKKVKAAGEQLVEEIRTHPVWVESFRVSDGCWGYHLRSELYGGKFGGAPIHHTVSADLEGDGRYHITNIPIPYGIIRKLGQSYDVKSAADIRAREVVMTVVRNSCEVNDNGKFDEARSDWDGERLVWIVKNFRKKRQPWRVNPARVLAAAGKSF